jgi:hypothetical protein
VLNAATAVHEFRADGANFLLLAALAAWVTVCPFKTNVGAAVYARRKCLVEPVFGQIKQARGFRQFLLRGLEKVRGEWALICMTHNLLKFHKICYG